MKLRFPGSLILSIPALALGVSCSEPAPVVDQSADETSEPRIDTPIRLPVTRTLRNIEGKEIQARIIGRNSTSITIVRLSDQKEFAYPVANLSEPDKSFIARIPMKSPRKAPEAEATESGPIVFLQARLKEVEEELAVLTKLKDELDPSSLKGRTTLSRLEKLSRERFELTSEITSLRSSGF